MIAFGSSYHSAPNGKASETKSKPRCSWQLLQPGGAPRTDIVSITPGAVGCIARLGVSSITKIRRKSGYRSADIPCQKKPQDSGNPAAFIGDIPCRVGSLYNTTT